LPWDVIFYFNMKKAKCLLTASSIIFFLSWNYHRIEFLQIFTPEFCQKEFISFLYPLTGFIIAISLASYVNREIIERVEVQRLNQQIEKLTIEKERNRMAQEIHDSLGHSLTGLIMHLDLLEKIIEKEKAQRLVVKAQNLARQGMKEVRLAVKTLGERDYQDSFKKALNRLCDNLQIESGLTIRLDLAPEVENLSPKLKSIFYKNIQEALTNSIKHGKSQKVQIQIGLKDNLLFCEIVDDGTGCVELQKGNGLMGMEERLKSVSGQIYWSSNIREGFTLRFELAREVEEYE
ncbi:MAG: sensor histidine kinase, partial [Desulfobacterales bacterium]|nr:sensor histidine kinase [Desulfobacterales bacterium]